MSDNPSISAEVMTFRCTVCGELKDLDEVGMDWLPFAPVCKDCETELEEK